MYTPEHMGGMSMKRIGALGRVLTGLLITGLIISQFIILPGKAVGNTEENSLSVEAPCALLMEKTSGEVIYEKNADEMRPPASVTKVMTLLLVMEELKGGLIELEDTVICSSRAASMGGSQIWLEEGESMTVSDMIKAVTVVSANDCAVALAEHIAGSEEAFVIKMNEKAVQLGMNNTRFVDCTGLTEDPGHLTTARDIALMSRELISHDIIKQYTTIWMDSLRGGESELTNTNKLVKHFQGTTGLKTGYTSKAGYCLSAAAEREGIEYIAVILGAETSDQRFNSAKTLLNFAFANYALCSLRSPQVLPPVPVELGEADSVQPLYNGPETKLVEKSLASKAEYKIDLPESINAPVSAGQKIGELVVSSQGKELARIELTADADVGKITVLKVYGRLIIRLLGG